MQRPSHPRVPGVLAAVPARAAARGRSPCSGAGGGRGAERGCRGKGAAEAGTGGKTPCVLP